MTAARRLAPFPDQPLGGPPHPAPGHPASPRGLPGDAGPEAAAAETPRTRDAEEDWNRFVALAGRPTTRLWRHYPAGAGPAFDERRMGVHRIPAERPVPPATEGSAVR
ncbi:hypothetical protein RM844_14425 [Streptomyces sp. DSM 44915]|uniref:Uncharacterized protein n=1 Tax=Streptomyces chisholmiae TaxID=3075540 RepID=A0ABU2JR74_9ACTN|nr:hypothetical protein [Streptomyces sp. DSM 44915]MDT0267483.1 hypothetical protein [Streptomyces sp. DSM 44915]